MTMTTIIRILIGMCLTYMVGIDEPKVLVKEYQPTAYTEITNANPTKDKAFVILTNKCNVCHEKRNRRRVFTQSTMYAWSQDVYKQVFIKKRMPKGKKIKLTSEEYQDLITWISSLKNNQNGNQL